MERSQPPDAPELAFAPSAPINLGHEIEIRRILDGALVIGAASLDLKNGVLLRRAALERIAKAPDVRAIARALLKQMENAS